MTFSHRSAGRRAVIAASMAAVLMLAGCDVGEGNTLAFLTITDSRLVKPDGDVEIFQCLPSRLFVVGTFDDGDRDTSIGFREGAVWTSSNEAVVRVSNGEIVVDDITLSRGTLIASSLPAAVNQAATISVSFQGLTASQTVVVRPGTLEVSPTSQTLAVGTALQMFATAIFGQDGATDSTGTNLAADFGNLVDWSSDDEGVATVNANGVVTGVAGGTANIRAITGANCPVPADLTTQVTVQNTTLSAGNPFDFIATGQFDFADIGMATSTFVRLIGNFASGLRQDLTGQADLVSDDALVVSEFSNLVTGKGAPSATDATTLTASFDQDADGPNPAVTEQQPVTVDDGKSLNSMVIEPAGPISILQGTARDLSVLGTFDDGTMQSLYRNVFWSTSNSALVSVSIAGIVTASADDTGNVTITATRTDPLSNAQFAPTLSIDVVSALDNATLQVNCTDPIQAGTAADCTATATLVGGQTQDVSLSAVWGSTSPAVAEVSNVRLMGARRNELSSTSPLPGRVYALSAGSTTIRASLFDADGNRLATGTDTVTVN